MSRPWAKVDEDLRAGRFEKGQTAEAQRCRSPASMLMKGRRSYGSAVRKRYGEVSEDVEDPR